MWAHGSSNKYVTVSWRKSAKGQTQSESSPADASRQQQRPQSYVCRGISELMPLYETILNSRENTASTSRIWDRVCCQWWFVLKVAVFKATGQYLVQSGHLLSVNASPRWKSTAPRGRPPVTDGGASASSARQTKRTRDMRSGVRHASYTRRLIATLQVSSLRLLLQLHLTHWRHAVASHTCRHFGLLRPWTHVDYLEQHAH